MAADAGSLSRVERVESTLLSQRLVEKREKEKKICDRADAFALERLGHEYVRINNRTVAIRWERWDASGDRLKQASAVQMQSIAVAVEHYVYKLVKCQARLDAYIKRGLFLRSRHQAAEKVLKVVADVEQAHAALLAHADSVMQDPERLARMPSAQVSSMRLPAGASVDLQTAASARQQQGAGSPFAAAQAQQQHQQQQQLQGQASRTQHLGSSGAQQPGSSAAQLPGSAGTATAAAAHAFHGALPLSTSATQTDVEPLADTWKARGGGAAAWGGNGGGGKGDDWTRQDAGWGPGGAGADVKGVSSASSARALISTHPQPFGSPMTVNPLAKLGYVVQVQPGGGQDGRQQEAGPAAAAAGQEMERGVAIGPSAHAAGNGRPADSAQAAPSPLVLGPDGTLLLGGQRYVVAWAPQGSVGGANALLIPVPAVLPAPPQAALQSAAAAAPLPAGAESAAGQQAGLAAAATAAASSRAGPECGPSGGPFAEPLNPSPQQQQQQQQLQPMYSLDDPPPRPPGSEGYIPPVQPVSLAHLASASLSAAAARQLLACYSPNSATAALESAGRRAWGQSLLPGGGGGGGGSPAARARSGSATASSSEGRGATPQGQASHPLGSPPGGPADAGLSASANAASQRPSPAHAASTPGAASTRGARGSPAHSTTTVSRLPPAPLVTNESKTARRSLWSRLPPPGASLARSRPRTASAAVPTLDAPHRGAATAGATAYGSQYGRVGVQAAGLGPDRDAGRKDMRAQQLVASLVAPVSSAVRQSMLLSRYARGGDVVGGVPDGSRREGGFGAYPSAGGLHLAGRGEDDAGWGRQGHEPLGSGDQGHTYLVGATTGSTGDREWAEASAAAARDAVRGAPASGAAAQNLERLEPGGRPAAAPDAAADPAHPSSGGGAGVRAYAATLKAQAEQGSIEAVEELGCLIRSGAPGMPAQPDVARGLLLYAAESGSASAARMLGEMYATGEGGEQNPDEAEAWLATAREL